MGHMVVTSRVYTRVVYTKSLTDPDSVAHVFAIFSSSWHLAVLPGLPRLTRSTNMSNDTFLFTSESVGEGHPGLLRIIVAYTKTSFATRSLMPCSMPASRRILTAVLLAVENHVRKCILKR